MHDLGVEGPSVGLGLGDHAGVDVFRKSESNPNHDTTVVSFAVESSMDLLRYFERDNLPTSLQWISEGFRELATELAGSLEGDPELDAVLRKLLEAKDCAARAVVYAQQETTEIDSSVIGSPDGPVGARLETFDALLSVKRHAPVVYFIRNGNRVKIGTTQNLKGRASGLSLRVKDIVRVEHGGVNHERDLHVRFAAQRIGNTEWFELRGAVADHIARRETIQERVRMTLTHCGELRRRDLEALIGLSRKQALDALIALKPTVERTERGTWKLSQQL